MLLAALRSDAVTTLVVGVLAVLVVGVWWRRNAAAAGAVLSLAVTLVVTSTTTEWAGTRSPLVSPVRSGLVFWLFAVVVLATVWLTPSPRASRATTTAMAHGVLVVASVFVTLAPAVVPTLGLAGAMAVVAWRSRSPRPRTSSGTRPETSGDASRADRLRGVGRTKALLSAELGAEWHVLDDRRLDGGTPVEQLLVGPAGVVVVATRRWSGQVSLVAVDDETSGAAYALDGDPHALAARLLPLARAVCGVADRLGVDLAPPAQSPDESSGRSVASAVGVMVLWDDMVLPEEHVELTVLPRGVERPVTVCLVRGGDLMTWLRSRPTRLTARQVKRLARRAAALPQRPSVTRGQAPRATTPGRR